MVQKIMEERVGPYSCRIISTVDFVKEVAKLAWSMQNKMHEKKSEISVLLTDDVFIHELNLKYRKMDKPTNVLSFPLDDEILRGDIIVAYEYSVNLMPFDI